MWPKMLIEMLPHLARLVPMAERFFASRQADERASENALQAMAEGVRGDLGQVTAAHAGLYRQLQDLSAQVTLLEGEVKAAREAAKQEAALARLAREQMLAAVTVVKRVVFATCVLVVIVLTIVILRVR